MIRPADADTCPWAAGIAIELEIGIITLRSRVEAIRDQELLITPPSLDGRRVRLLPDTRVTVVFFSRGGCWQADAYLGGRCLGEVERVILRDFSHWQPRHRRRDQRYPRRLAIEICRENPQTAAAVALTEEISVGGLSTVLSEALAPQPGELVGLKLHVEPERAALSARARVVRRRRRFGRVSGQVDVALEFDGLGSGERDVLLAMIAARTGRLPRPSRSAPAVGTRPGAAGTG